MSFYKYSNLRMLGSLEYKKWFPHIGTFRAIKKKTNGELRLFVDIGSGEYSSVTDSQVKDMFLWFGRYLAFKGKLPNNIKLAETSVLAGRVKTQIMEVVAMNVYEDLK